MVGLVIWDAIAPIIMSLLCIPGYLALSMHSRDVDKMQIVKSQEKVQVQMVLKYHVFNSNIRLLDL